MTYDPWEVDGSSSWPLDPGAAILIFLWWLAETFRRREVQPGPTPSPEPPPPPPIEFVKPPITPIPIPLPQVIR